MDVAVIGGGIAGLSAATALRALGIDVLVIEARERLGGRIHTIVVDGAPLDLGAAFVHGAGDLNPITRLMADAGIELLDPHADSAPQYFAAGAPLGDADADRIDRLAEAASRKIHKLARTADASATVDDAIASTLAGVKAASPTVRSGVAHALAAEFEIVRGEDARRLSLAQIDADVQLPGGDLVPRGGYARLIDWLAQNVPVRFNFAVRNIAYDSEGVTISSDRETVRCRRALITLPLGVLKNDKVVFDPPLPETKRSAIARLGVGAVNKVFLRFENPFWPPDTTILSPIGADREHASEFYALTYLDGEAILVWFLKGDDSRRLDAMEEEAFNREAVARLHEAFGEATPLPSKIIRSRWTCDPWTLGSHTVMTPGASPSDTEALAAPVGDRLFFAGEATSAEFFGTVHGAWLSGQRAAREIAGS